MWRAPETTDVWDLRFEGGLVDGAQVAVAVVVLPSLAFVFPCPSGCERPHRQARSHLTFDPEKAPPSSLAYRRTSLDRSRMLAVYELGDSSDRSPVGERELVEA